jgi:hypothetical protein
MTAPTIQPGTLCLILRSNNGNEGREVTALRQVAVGEYVPEIHAHLLPSRRLTGTGWLVEARYPLAGWHGCHMVTIASALLPLLPPGEPAAHDLAQPVEAGEGAAA